MVQSAADGAGWTLQGGIVYETLPDSGVFTCGGGPVAWTISDENQNIIVASAGWTCVKRWTQTVTETYTLSVSNSASVGSYGALIEEDGASYTEDYDDGQWDQSIAADTPSGAGWAVNGIGDYTKDEITRAETDEVIETLLARAAARIAATHRRNFLDYELPYDATVDIGDAGGSGTVYQLTHRLDPTSGRATTLVRIAYSSTTGGSADALDAPSPPDTSPSHGAPDTSTTLPTRIGSVTGVPPFDEDWEGYTGNVVLPDAGAEVYDNRFRVVTPDIEDESRDEVTAEAVAAYGVSL